jgi:NAD(P)-dependent dehydrogenase (short-subunit alcohol dehydrogenase family)
MSLQGKVALIIGADHSNGPHRAQQFASQGASSALHCYTSDNKNQAERLGLQLRTLCPDSRITFHTSDLETCDSIKAMFREVVASHVEIEYVSTPDGIVSSRPERVPSGIDYHDMLWYRVFLYQQVRTAEQKHADFLLNTTTAGRVRFGFNPTLSDS